ncbi:hypothetical protein HZS_564 [Henneguya salminicola]|uniref:Nucleoporin Nup43 (Trinotate prediction) n=1 Tax=Henneguya salminicola TaxID=69463 RepID=A0A6G3MFW0_HENSL|nr:hypothetical protein HZS_564 [Henneguya salminicola]
MDLVELSRYPIKGDINCIKFVDSNSLIVSDSNGVLRLMTFDTEFHAKHEWNPAQANNKSTSNIYNFDIHEHGQIVTVTLDGSVNFFHMSEPKPIKQLSHFSSCSLWTVKFLKSPLQFLTGNNYGEVKLCDMNISECQTAKKFLLNGKLSAAKTIALNPLDENIFLVGYSDGSLQVWDIRKEISPISKLNIHTSDGILL